MSKTNKKERFFWISEWKIPLKEKVSELGPIPQLGHKYKEQYFDKFPFDSSSLVYNRIPLKVKNSNIYSDTLREIRFLNIYLFKNSNIFEEVYSLDTECLGYNCVFNVKILLRTPKDFLSKIKHNSLERKINFVINPIVVISW